MSASMACCVASLAATQLRVSFLPARLAENLLRGVRRGGVAHPVLHLCHRDLHRARDVARRNARAAQQGNQQAVGVEGVAALFVEGVLRALHAAVAGEVVDAVQV